MAFTVVSTTSLQYTPPSAPVGSGQPSFVSQCMYNAQQVGTIDVPAGTTVGTVFDVAFGSVNKAKCVVVKNLMSSDVDIRINGSVAATFTLPPQGKFAYDCPVDPTDGLVPMSSISITILNSPMAAGFLTTFVFGD